MGKRIHQLIIFFHVTPEIKRYVYVYIIVGEFCYLIDSGVDGAEEIIANYLKSIGRNLTDVKGIFLTHAHPDRIGSAAKIREMTGCKIYASAGESRWISDVDLQFAERPIPNFYTLVNKSVPVDEILNYLLPEERCIFTGDAIPVRGDIPIWIQRDDNRKSLEKLKKLNEVDLFYPAWDETYDREQAMDKIEDAKMLMDEIQRNVDRCKGIAESPDELVIKKADKVKTQFEKCAKTYPYQNDVQSERELREIAEKNMQGD